MALVTSREHLRIDGELVHELGPLSSDVDGGDADAVTLFVERAAITRPGLLRWEQERWRPWGHQSTPAQGGGPPADARHHVENARHRLQEVLAPEGADTAHPGGASSPVQRSAYLRFAARLLRRAIERLPAVPGDADGGGR